MQRQHSRGGSGAGRGVVAIVGALMAMLLGVAGVGLHLLHLAAESVEAEPEAPVDSEFFGAWCSSSGDRLDLTDGRFSIDPLSPTLAGQIAFFIPTPDPRRPHHWDDPPAGSAAGSWGLDVLGPDLLSDQIVTIDVDTEQLDDENVAADELDLSVYRTDTGWRPYLELKPAGAGVMTFNRCAKAEPA